MGRDVGVRGAWSLAVRQAEDGGTKVGREGELRGAGTLAVRCAETEGQVEGAERGQKPRG